MGLAAMECVLFCFAGTSPSTVPSPLPALHSKSCETDFAVWSEIGPCLTLYSPLPAPAWAPGFPEALSALCSDWGVCLCLGVWQ